MNIPKVLEMDSLGSRFMPVTLLTTRAFDQQGAWPIKLLAYRFVKQNNAPIHTQTDTQCDNSYTVSVVDYMGF